MLVTFVMSLLRSSFQCRPAIKRDDIKKGWLRDYFFID